MSNGRVGNAGVFSGSRQVAYNMVAGISVPVDAEEDIAVEKYRCPNTPVSSVVAHLCPPGLYRASGSSADVSVPKCVLARQYIHLGSVWSDYAPLVGDCFLFTHPGRTISQHAIVRRPAMMQACGGKSSAHALGVGKHSRQAPVKSRTAGEYTVQKLVTIRGAGESARQHGKVADLPSRTM